jgi:hypothetical protein
MGRQGRRKGCERPWMDFWKLLAVSAAILVSTGHQSDVLVEAFPSTFSALTLRRSSSNILSLRSFDGSSKALFLLPNDDDKDKQTPDETSRNRNKLEEVQESWLERRLQKADFSEMRRDAVLVTCFVLSRFLVYDILTSTKVTPGWVVQDVVWLTGTFSSATVLVIYWTIAGLLSKSFENSGAYGPVQVLVNVALCCPIWLATEHIFGFGPSNIGGDTLSQAIATGFLGLASFMTLARALTSGWE